MGSGEEDLQDSKKIRNRQFIRVACGIMALAIFAYGYDFVVDLLNPLPAPSKPVQQQKKRGFSLKELLWVKFLIIWQKKFGAIFFFNLSVLRSRTSLLILMKTHGFRILRLRHLVENG